MATFLIGLQISTAKADELPATIDRARPSVAELELEGQDANGASVAPYRGTAFVVHTDTVLKRTFLITAAHVLRPDSKWLTDNDGRVMKRTIRIRRQNDSGKMEVVADNATVVRKPDFDTDAAVLSIPQTGMPILLVAGSATLRQGDLVALLGYPATEDGFIAKVMRFRKPDFANMRIYLEDPADPGQSGGPVVDGNGRAVGIASENTDKENPISTHRAALASAGLEILNAYLRESGRPALALADQSSAKASIASRTGNIDVRVAGNGGGTLGKGLTASELVDSTQEATVEASGGETSDCDEALGRTLSKARASGAVKLFEANGVMLTVDLSAHGGHYRSAKTCLSGKPVGLTAHDTAATAFFKGVTEIAVTASSVPVDLRIAWRGMPSGSRIDVLDPNSSLRGSEQLNDESGERTVKADIKGRWRVRSSIDLNVQAVGGTETSNLSKRPIVFVEAR